MSRIDKLLYLAIVPPFLIALTVLTFVVSIHEFGHLSELLITHNASLGTITIMAGTILPRILIFSLPLSYLIGILIGLSGLSGESQITALRACGVPLRKLLAPVLALGGIIGLMTAAFSIVILPKTNDLLGLVKNRISLRQATSQIQPRVFNESFKNLVVYLDDLAVDKQHWSRVFLVDNTNPKAPKTLLARDGIWVSDSTDSQLQLHLEHGRIYEVDPDHPHNDNKTDFAATDIPIVINRGSLSGGEAEPADDRKPKKPEEQSTLALWRGRPGINDDDRLEQLVELHRRLAVPFSVLPFALLGLSLGIGTKKGGRTSGFILSLGLVLLFYLLFWNGIRLAHVRKLPPWLGAWSANLILMLLGLAFMSGAERHSKWIVWFSSLRTYLDSVTRRGWLVAIRNKVSNLDEVILKSGTRLAGFRFPKVLDLYVSRGFFVYFFWSLLVCGSLFILLTLFDLLNYIIRNRTPISYVVDYFVFLTPQILMLVVPMSVLLAILINFGILEKSSEITALKAGGWSLYRLALPVFLIAGAFCVNLYVMQDYVLPYANIRQDNLRNIIKGTPARTSMRPQRWLFGESNRIFNYAYYDAGNNLFVGLNIFEVDLRELKILRRFHAARATIEDSGTWLLEDGWVRDFQSEQAGFKNIKKAEYRFPEKPGYFQKEIFEPKESAKLTYLELKDYIKYLKQAGYNATELQVELYKKISFPLSCLVMALLGVPFSFSMGKKGAFFGITASIAIAISYWGVFSVFEQMGAYGLLIPLLAAWAPNLLFGATGLVLLLTIRT